MSAILFLPVGQLTGRVEVEVEVGIVSLRSAVDVPLDDFESDGVCLIVRKGEEESV